MMGYPQQRDEQNADGLLPAPVSQPHAVDVSPQEVQTRQALVLIVEDHREMSRFIDRTLSATYCTAIAHDGQEGLSQALTLKPDLIICDVMMPRMSGEELVYAVRAHPELDTVPIVLLSGRTDDLLRVQLLRAGAQDFLVKPFHPEELRVRVANLIKMKQTHELLQREVADQYQDIASLANAVTARTQEIQCALDILRENEAHLEAIFEAVTDGLYVYDAQGHLLKMNSAARRSLGLDSQAEITAFSTRPPDERVALFTPHDEHGQPLPPDQWPIARLLCGEVLKGASMPDLLLRTSDGEEVQFSLSGAPMWSHDGRIVGAVAVSRDVTERRRLEQRTREALDALLAMAEALVDIPAEAAITNRQAASASEVARRLAELASRVLGCRRLSITAIEPESELLRSVAVCGLSSEQEQRWWAERREIPLSDSPYQSLVSRLRAKEVLLLDMTQSPLGDHPNRYGVRTALIAPMSIEDRLVGFLSIDYGDAAHDFTAAERSVAQAVAHFAALILERQRLLRERAEAESRELALRETNQRMDAFLGIASHELRTPLTTIIASMQLMERQFRRLAGPQGVSQEDFASRVKTAQESLAEAGRQLWRLNRLVSELLDVSRIQANKLTLQMEQCDLAAIVQGTVDEQRRVNQARHIELEVRAAAPVPILADADRIGQVVTNYLTNALKYSPPHQPITIVLEVEEQGARVSVHDKGPGLAPSQQERIWERFYRVQGVNVQSGSHVGLGLGLYICRTIIEEHQGKVGVHTMPGNGSIFWFTLPLIQQEEQGAL